MSRVDPQRVRRASRVGVVVVALLLAVGSLWPRPPGTGPGIPVVTDKHLHFAGYTALGAVAVWAAGRDPRRIALAVALAAGYGLALEVGQLPLATRSFSLLDQLANTAGALVGGTAAWLTRRRLAGRREAARREGSVD